MISNLYNNLDVAIIAAIISAIVSVLIAVFGRIIDWLREKNMLNYKLNREYSFKQMMGIKEKLSGSKTPLIKAAEDLNHRLWNFAGNIDKEWHICNRNDWANPNGCYYIKSFTYRFLVFFYWLDKAENDIYCFDFSQASKSEKDYLKFIKTLKFFFCDGKLLRSLNYDVSAQRSHFFVDNIKEYISYIKSDTGVIGFEEFKPKMEKEPELILPMIHYITDIRKDGDNCNYNVIICFHLFLMLFLNKYGLDYQYTDRNKFRNLIRQKYNDIRIKKDLYEFLVRNKIQKQAKWIIKDLELNVS